MIPAEHARGVLDVVGVDRVALFQQAVELVQKILGQFGRIAFALDEDGRAAGVDADVQNLRQPLQVGVVLAEQVAGGVVVRER